MARPLRGQRRNPHSRKTIRLIRRFNKVSSLSFFPLFELSAPTSLLRVLTLFYEKNTLANHRLQLHTATSHCHSSHVHAEQGDDVSQPTTIKPPATTTNRGPTTASQLPREYHSCAGPRTKHSWPAPSKPSKPCSQRHCLFLPNQNHQRQHRTRHSPRA